MWGLPWECRGHVVCQTPAYGDVMWSVNSGYRIVVHLSFVPRLPRNPGQIFTTCVYFSTFQSVLPKVDDSKTYQKGISLLSQLDYYFVPYFIYIIGCSVDLESCKLKWINDVLVHAIFVVCKVYLGSLRDWFLSWRLWLSIWMIRTLSTSYF